MNIIKFAKLASYLSTRFGWSLGDDELTEIAGNVQQIIDAEQFNRISLVPMFDFMLAGKKIDAIKEHRRLTGMGLKESKDEVERIMNCLKEPATLGDILNTALNNGR